MLRRGSDSVWGAPVLVVLSGWFSACWLLTEAVRIEADDSDQVHTHTEKVAVLGAREMQETGEIAIVEAGEELRNGRKKSEKRCT